MYNYHELLRPEVLRPPVCLPLCPATAVPGASDVRDAYPGAPRPVPHTEGIRIIFGSVIERLLFSF